MASSCDDCPFDENYARRPLVCPIHSHIDFRSIGTDDDEFSCLSSLISHEDSDQRRMSHSDNHFLEPTEIPFAIMIRLCSVVDDTSESDCCSIDERIVDTSCHVGNCGLSSVSSPNLSENIGSESRHTDVRNRIGIDAEEIRQNTVNGQRLLVPLRPTADKNYETEDSTTVANNSINDAVSSFDHPYDEIHSLIRSSNAINDGSGDSMSPNNTFHEARVDDDMIHFKNLEGFYPSALHIIDQQNCDRLFHEIQKLPGSNAHYSESCQIGISSINSMLLPPLHPFFQVRKFSLDSLSYSRNFLDDEFMG